MRCRPHLLWVFALILIGAGTVGAQVHHVARPDPMEVYFLMDVDRLGDRVRVLYRSSPSLEQQARGRRNVNVYIVELYADGTVKQQRLASGLRGYGSLLLRRGHEELFLVPALGPGKPQPLEVRSTRDGSVPASNEVSVLPNIQLGVLWGN